MNPYAQEISAAPAVSQFDPAEIQRIKDLLQADEEHCRARPDHNQTGRETIKFHTKTLIREVCSCGWKGTWYVEGFFRHSLGAQICIQYPKYSAPQQIRIINRPTDPAIWEPPAWSDPPKKQPGSVPMHRVTQDEIDRLKQKQNANRTESKPQ
jgi:hypothetical protein